MTSSFSLGRRQHFNPSSATGPVWIMQTKDLDEKSQISFLIMNEFFQVSCGGGHCFSQQASTVLRTKLQSHTAEKLASIFTVTGHSLLHEAGKEYVRQVSRACTAGQTCAASDQRVSRWFFTLLRKKSYPNNLEQEPIFAKCLEQESGSFKDWSFAIGFKNQRLVLSFTVSTMSKTA